MGKKLWINAQVIELGVEKTMDNDHNANGNKGHIFYRTYMSGA